MSKQTYSFDDFLKALSQEHKEFAKELNDMIVTGGFSPQVELKKTGFAVSYKGGKPKKTVANFGTRKKGVFIRIYGENMEEYMHVFNKLPQSMVAEIAKAGDCKRMIDPESCNPKCTMGYIIHANGQVYEKCRYSALQFFLDEEKHSHIKEMVHCELAEREQK